MPPRKQVSIALLVEASCLSSLPDVLRQIEDEHGPILNVAVCPVHQITQGLIPPGKARQILKQSEVILCDIRGDGPALGILKQAWHDSSNTVIPLLGGSRDLMALLRMGPFSMQRVAERGTALEVDYRRIKHLSNVVEKLGGILPVGALRHARNWVRCIKYWTNASGENLKNLLLFVAREYGGIRVRAKPPIEFPEYRIFHPVSGKWWRGLGEYLAAQPPDPGRPTVGLLFYGGMHFEASLAGARSLAERLAPYANLIPVASTGVLNLQAIRRYFLRRGRLLVDGIVSLLWFRLNGGPMGGDPRETIELLQQLGVPLFVPACMYSRELDRWRASQAGLSPVELIAAVTFPELDGGIEPVPLLGLEGTAAAAIPDRAERIARRVLNRVHLRYKPNAEKRVALLIYDYPPGEANLGNASYLDTFASLELILERLAEEGYRVLRPPEPIRELFFARGLVNSGQWVWPDPAPPWVPRVPIDKYIAWFQQLPEDARLAVEREWGPPPGNIMVQGSDILLPGLDLGNVFIGVQPARGVHEDPSKLYHHRSLSPHHQYMAFYLWLREEWRADALVHVGTHGTLEFLPGKEVGLSARCFPDVLMGDVPHLYIYHVTNPSEAMVARRRGYATLVNHAPPPFDVAGLHGELLELEDLLAEYREAQLQDPPRAARVEEKLREAATALHLPASPEELHERLAEMKRAIIPRGLHVFGRNLSEEATRELLSLILRYDRTEARSLLRLVLEAEGHDYHHAVTRGEPWLERAEKRARSVLFSYLDTGRLPPEAGGIDDRELLRTLGFATQVADRVRSSDELGSLVEALAGGYTRPNIAGDPVRTPEVFPTGSNSYQFDPRLVPSEAAYERGKEIAENTLRAFYREHGRYPRSVGVVLWGFETAKTRGETVGQILAYLGVRVVRGQGWYPALELVPGGELGRPRIDVLVTMCGFFRDLFPNLVSLLDQAFRLAGEQEESDNFVRDNTRRVLSVLLESGIDEANASRLATGRLFGPRAGEYGTKVTTLVESSRWETKDQLVQEYATSMGHLYGENLHGAPAHLVFNTLLSRTELVSQVRDTHEYDFTDLDHYYEFFGGLAASVEKASGSKPQMLVSDTTGEVVRTRSATEAIVKASYTRLLNPRWIEGMLAHEFHGAQKIADRVEYLLGLAATVGVPGELFARVAGRLVFDERVLSALARNNPYACFEMLGRLLESVRRGFWNPTGEQLAALRRAYLRVEETLEGAPTPGRGESRELL